MLADMAKQTGKKKMYVRADAQARYALKTMLVALQSPDILPELTQEEFVTASWLWMSKIGTSELAKCVRPFVLAMRGVQVGGELTVEKLSGSARAVADSEAEKAKGRVAKPKGPKQGPVSP